MYAYKNEWIYLSIYLSLFRIYLYIYPSKGLNNNATVLLRPLA